MVKIHFLNVGPGDCTIIYFPPRQYTDNLGRLIKYIDERVMMIDMNHHENHDDYENVIEYYKRNFGNKPIFRFICTHPHHDHICGIHKLFLDQNIEILNFWDVTHAFTPESYDGHNWHEIDWKTYKLLSNPNTTSPKTINLTRESSALPFWDDTEDRITILSPTTSMIREAHAPKKDGTLRKPHEVNIDDLSYALLLQVGKNKIIFAGDGREKTWNDIFQNCGYLIKDCDLLKAGHHGQESGFYEGVIKLMSPKNIIISNSKEEDESNGASNLYKRTIPTTRIYKTYEHGNIIASCDYQNGITIE